MVQTCPRCSRVNPVEASYCYFDGSALDNRAQRLGPINTGQQPFHNPFIFPSGRVCGNFDQLALACQEHWSEALTLLQQGYLESFLALGRTDLALAAREAARFPDQDRGLDQFLGKLPTQALQPPKLHVLPVEVNLGQIEVGRDQRVELHLTNLGMGLLYGSMSCEGFLWLAIGDGAGVPRKLFELRAEALVPLHIRGQHLRAGPKPLEGKIVVESNGGTFTLPVRAEVPVRPFALGVLAGAQTPRQLAEKAKKAPKEAAALFENGHVAAWYQSNGWIYPVQGPAASGIGAVQQYFEALGLTPPPKVEISESAVNMYGNAGDRLERTLEVRTPEKRPVYAHATSDQPWLHVGAPRLLGRTATIPLVVPSIPYRPGEILRANVQVTSNGNQRFTVPVALAIGGKPLMGNAIPTVLPAGEPMTVLPVAAPTFVPGQTNAWAPTATLAPVESIPIVQPAAPAPPAVLPTATAAAPPPLWATSPPRQAEIPVLRAVQVMESAPIPTAFPALQSVGPHAPVVNMPRASSRRGCAWVTHLLPGLLLLLFLAGVAARDLIVRALHHDKDDDAEEVLDPTPKLDIKFHDQAETITVAVGGSIKPGGAIVGKTDRVTWEPTMRFGLVTRDPKEPKRLTYRENGTTNNTCVRLDGQEVLFGETAWRTKDGRVVGENWPGRWKLRQGNLGHDGDRQRIGARSIWVYDQEQVQIIQTVELVYGAQSRKLDTCLVRYELVNQDSRAHFVGLRFLLDTYIGTNDGVPFMLPGRKQLCDEMMDFGRAEDVPDYLEAFERQDLTNPGTIAHVQLKVKGLEAPSRVTLGAWPHPDLDPKCRQERTLWEFPLKSIKEKGDSAVTIYWREEWLQPAAHRLVGFEYGLGNVESGEGSGKLGLSEGGSFTPGGEFTITAYVQDPKDGQTVTLDVPDGLTIVGGAAEQKVPPLSAEVTSHNSPVTWRLQAGTRTGKFRLSVRSSTGEKQSKTIRIVSVPRAFD